MRGLRLFIKYLESQKSAFEEKLRALKEDYAAAENTFKTVRTSGRLIEMIRLSEGEFEALLNVDIPEVLPFYNRAMEEEFERLTSALRQIQ